MAAVAPAEGPLGPSPPPGASPPPGGTPPPLAGSPDLAPQPRALAYLGDGLQAQAHGAHEMNGAIKSDVISLPVPEHPPSRQGFLQRVWANRGARERNFAEEYKNLRMLIRSRFKNSKLNLRRAEVYIKVQKVNLEAMELYRELAVYLTFTTLFFWLVVNVIPLHANNNQDAALTAPGALLNFVMLGSDQTAYLAMNTIEDYYAYIQNILLPLLDIDSTDSFQWQRKRVGTVRMRQVRVQGYPCSALDPKSMRMFDNSTCFSDFRISTEDKYDQPGQNRTYIRSQLQELSPSEMYLRDGSQTWSYGYGGFVVDLPPDLQSANDTLNQLMASGWVDEGTRVVVTSYALQNPHTGTFVVADMIAELPASGLLYPSANINTLKLQLLDRSDPVFAVGILFLIFVLGYILSEMKQMADSGLLMYLRDGWNAWDIADLAMIVVLYFRFGEYVNFSRDMQFQLTSNPDPRKFYDFGRGMALMVEMQQIAGIAILITCIRIFKFFELNPRLSVLTNTVGKAVPDLSAFLLIFVILFAGYAFMAWVMFGYKVADFSSFYASFSTLFSNLGGGFNLGDLTDAAPGGAVVFFFSFVVVVSLVLVNIFIAIVNKYYVEAGDAGVQREEEFMSELDDEDRMSVLKKFMNLQVTVTHVREDTGELEPGKVTHEAEKGSVVRIWLSTRDTRPGTTTVTGAARPQSAARTARRLPRSGSMTHYTPGLECIAQGKVMWTRFLREVMDVGDHIALRSEDFSCRLRVVKLSSLDGGVYMDCFVLAPSRIPNGAALRLSNWTSFKRIISLYLMSPSVMQAYRANRFFGEYNISRAPAILRDEEIEAEVMEISKRNADLRKRGIGVRRRTSYALDEMLMVIRELENDARNNEVTGINSDRVGQIVYEAIGIDALHRRLCQISDEMLKLHKAGLGTRAQRAASNTHASLEQANTDEDAIVKDIARVYAELMAAAEAFDRRIGELRAHARGDEGAAVVEGLRFDEVCDLIRSLVIKQGRTGFDEIDIKKEAIRFLSSFPNSCFDAVDFEQERGQMYWPRPYDTSEIADGDRDPKKVLSKLVSTLGAVVHDAWSMSKLEAGWRYGPNRDNASKMHNCLKPFDELSAEEQAYDVDMAIQILRAVIFFGYDLVPPAGGGDATGASSLVEVAGQQRFPGALKAGYTLRQIDVSRVEESDDVKELIELLAKNVHDLWAKKRKEEGWTYAETLDDRKRQHNLLVPYELLSEEEKRNDLNTVRSTIQSVLALGWRIAPRKQKRTLWLILRDFLGV